MREVLKNGCEIVRGHSVEVGIMQTEDAGKPLAYLFWMEAPLTLTGEREWRFCSRTEAILQINVWLECIGLALSSGAIVEF